MVYEGNINETKTLSLTTEEDYMQATSEYHDLE